MAAVTAAAATGVRRVVHASSGSVYGASGMQAQALHEDSTPLRPDREATTESRTASSTLRRASFGSLTSEGTSSAD